jgi:hypothetical protein
LTARSGFRTLTVRIAAGMVRLVRPLGGLPVNKSSTGLVVSLVVFVILTVGLLASTMFFYVQAESARQDARNEQSQRTAAADKARRAEEAFGALTQLVSGDAGSAADKEVVKAMGEQLKVASGGNLKSELETLRAGNERLTAETAELRKLAEDSKAAAAKAREDSSKARAEVDKVRADVERDVAGYREASEKGRTEVAATVNAINKVQDDAAQRHQTALQEMQRRVDDADASKQDLAKRIESLQEAVDKNRAKPENPAALVDGRVIDVSDADGQVFVSIGSKQRVQPGMTFDVYDSPTSIQANPTTGDLVPGKARIQILKVEAETSTARVIPPDTAGGAGPARVERPVLRDDVIANAIFSPNQRYRFLVHGKFDVDEDGRATEAETDFVRASIKRWGGEVVEGDELRGDLDFVVMGVRPKQPADLGSNADSGAYAAYLEQKTAYENYQRLFGDAQGARIPVLNWNRMQVLTNAGR